jgi:hypothetical protein
MWRWEITLLSLQRMRMMKMEKREKRAREKKVKAKMGLRRTQEPILQPTMITQRMPR